MKQRIQESDEKRGVMLHKGEQTASWFSAFNYSFRTALKIDRSKLTVLPAIRSTIGFVLPLAIGVATGHIVEGVSLAGGAATVGSVGLTYTHRARVRTMLLASAGIAFSAFIGSITGPIAWLSILVAGIWGIGAGMLVAISQPMMIIGLQSALALIILSHFSLDPLHAVLQAALMFAGALLQTLLASLLAPNNTVLVILDGIMVFLAFSVLFANYAIFSVFITTETVLLLTFVIPGPLMTTAYRAVDTAIGGILALLIYALWPTWERAQVMPNIAQRIEAIREYFAAIMQAYTHPGAYDSLTAHNRLMEARLARSNAEASIARSLQEPEPHRIEASLAYGLLAASDRMMQHMLALEAYLIDNPKQNACPAITPFASRVDDALHILATSIQQGQPVTALPDLEEAMQTLKHTGKLNSRTAQEECANLSTVITEAKGIIRNVHILHSLLRTKTESSPQEGWEG